MKWWLTTKLSLNSNKLNLVSTATGTNTTITNLYLALRTEVQGLLWSRDRFGLEAPSGNSNADTCHNLLCCGVLYLAVVIQQAWDHTNCLQFQFKFLSFTSLEALLFPSLGSGRSVAVLAATVGFCIAAITALPTQTVNNVLHLGQPELPIQLPLPGAPHGAGVPPDGALVLHRVKLNHDHL